MLTRTEDGFNDADCASRDASSSVRAAAAAQEHPAIPEHDPTRYGDFESPFVITWTRLAATRAGGTHLDHHLRWLGLRPATAVGAKDCGARSRRGVRILE